ncbi:MAG TPA: hypothetical protein VGE07_08385 [Herpetosiphonaceae bacterium]
MALEPLPGAPADFDFEFGDWHVSHRRLRERLAGCTEWDSFSGRASTRPVLGGFGNVEDNLIDLPGGSYRALALRSFDPAARRWSIWWLDARFPGQVDVPVVGEFADGVGTFYADDALDGRPIKIRFLWFAADPARPRWEQAFSADGGASWETNWTMDFSR